ncbi:serine/threonine-protein kinase [Microbacterium sp. NPDC091313]
MTAHRDDEPTQALLGGRYRLGEVIGRGGMATVHRADDIVLERTVAVKVLREGADAAASPERARIEMTVLAGLNHPALVTLYDADIGPGRPNYLVMECVDGPSLAERLHEGPLPSRELARIISELAEALQVVHDSGVVHRDIKPSNVLLAPTHSPGRMYRAKLADFGVAFLVDSTRHTSPGLVIGTGAYLAPEQVRGEPLTPAADVYALGLMTLEALTGQRAYPHATGIGAVLARLAVAPEVPQWLGSRWRGLLERMTASDPTIRPTAGEIARLALTLPPVERPPAAASAGLDVPTQALPVAPAVTAPVVSDAAAPALPSARPAAAHASAAPIRRRRRRPRPWVVVGSVAASLALVLIVGLWALNAAGGAVGGWVPPQAEPTPSTTPAPADAVTQSDEKPADTTLGTVPASDVGPRTDGGASDDASQSAEPADNVGQADPSVGTGTSDAPATSPGAVTGGPGQNNGNGNGPGQNSGTGAGQNNGNGNGPGQNSGNGAGQNGGKAKDAGAASAPSVAPTAPAP